MHAIVTASGIESDAEVPGLKSVETANVAPASTSARTGGAGALSEKVDVGSTTAAVLPRPSAEMPSALTWFR